MFRKTPKLIDVKVSTDKISNCVYMDFIFKVRNSNYYYADRHTELLEISRMVKCDFEHLSGGWADAQRKNYEHRIVFVPNGGVRYNV